MNPQESLFRYDIGQYTITRILTSRKFMQNCYVVVIPTYGQIVFDPGDAPDAIADVIDRSSLPLKQLLLTHAHFDHIGAVSQLCQRYHVTCQLHHADLKLLKRAPIYSVRFGGKKVAEPQPVETFQELQLTLGDVQFMKTILSPGHTEGSVSFVFDPFVFTGDTLLNRNIGRTDLPGANKELLYQSVDHIITQLSDETTIFPGHGKPWKITEARVWWSQFRQVEWAGMVN